MKERKRISTLNLILIIQLVIMIILSTVITKTISKTTKQNSIEHMQTITDERAKIILNYVHNAENTLTYYSKAEQVVNLLSDPSNQEYIKKLEEINKEMDNIKSQIESLRNKKDADQFEPDAEADKLEENVSDPSNEKDAEDLENIEQSDL